MNTLKFNRRPLLLLFLESVFLLFPLLTLSLFPRSGAELKPLLELGWFNLFVVCGLAFALWMLVIRVKESFSYRIVFTSEAIEENHSLGFKTSLAKRILYREVQSVRYVFPNSIHINSTSDSTFKINLADIDGGADFVLDVLKSHLPAGLVGENLSAVVEKNIVLSRIANFGVLLFYGVILIPIAYGYRSPLKGGWDKYHTPWSESILYFSVTPQSVPWVVSTDFNDENLIIRSDEEEWVWPYPQPDDEEKEFSWEIALSDSQGQPTLIGREVNQTWQNGTWTQWKYYGAYSFIPLPDFFVATDEQAWLILSGGNGDYDLVVAAAGKTGVDVIKLPEFAEQRKYQPVSLSMLSDETVLVLAGNEEEAGVFLLKDGVWLEKSYHVPFSNIHKVKDFTLDASGHLFFIFDEGFKSKRFTIEMVDGEKVTTTYFNGAFDPSYLLIDSNNRVWVFLENDSGGVMVLQPVWGGEAELVVSYNENNSNFPSYLRSAPEISTDGKVWVLGQQLLWLDGSASELPAPPPAWLVDFSDSTKRIYLFIGIALVYFAGFSVLKLISSRISK